MLFDVGFTGEVVGIWTSCLLWFMWMCLNVFKCLTNLTTNGVYTSLSRASNDSDNGLSHIRHQAKTHLKISFTKWWPFRRDKYELKQCAAEFNLGMWNYTFQFSIISQHWDGAVGWQPRVILHDQYRYHDCWWVDTSKFSPFEISRDLFFQ